MDVFDLQSRLNKFDVRKELIGILSELEQKILDLNRKDQLFEKGENNEGTVIGIYKPLTEVLSGGKKKAGQPYNLFDTGDFYKKFTFDYKNGTLDLFSTDNKLDEIFDRIEKEGRVDPKSIFGLTIKNTEILNYGMLMPELIEDLNYALFRK